MHIKFDFHFYPKILSIVCEHTPLNMDTKINDKKNDEVIVIKKTRDTLIVQDGKMMRKYSLVHEWEVEGKKEKKAKGEKKRNEKKKDHINQVIEPKYVAEANALPKCEVHVKLLTPCGIQKLIQEENDRMKPQGMLEMSRE